MRITHCLIAGVLATLLPMSPVYANSTSPKPTATIQVVTVNVNSASAEELSDLLTGIGPAKAQAIVDYRKANGPFTSLDQLTQVKGIGPSTIEKNKATLMLK